MTGLFTFINFHLIDACYNPLIGASLWQGHGLEVQLPPKTINILSKPCPSEFLQTPIVSAIFIDGNWGSEKLDDGAKE